MLVPCALCAAGKTFDNVSSFRLHCNIEHPGCNFQCIISPCKRSYSDFESFRKHLINVHGVARKPSEQTRSFTKVNASSTCENAFEDLESESNAELSSSDPVKALENFLRNEISADLESIVLNQADILVAKLYSKMGLPRSMVSMLISDFTSFFSSGVVSTFQDLVLSFLSRANITHEEKSKVTSIFELLQNPFNHLSSDYLCIKHFQSTGYYIPPETFVIESRMEKVSTKEGTRFQMKEVTGQFIPLRKVFQHLFELPHALEDTIAYKTLLSLDTKYVSNFSQCEAWKRKIKNFPSDALVLPLMVYYDDFEPNNVLGPHCEKLGCVYVSLPLLPSECQSRLENIFLALLFNAADRQSYGNAKTFKPLINELNFLESEGISVKKSDGSNVKLYFVVGLALGDNLGLNGMCGFVESFNANYFCRMCKAPKQQTEIMLVEDVSVLRTPENYKADLNGNVQETGIKELCALEEISAFETPTDIGVDPFHELPEGVCHYTMIPILKHFHSTKPSFLENLNQRMYVFDYGVDNDNKPPSILSSMLDKNKLKMTGAEMLTFVRLFGVLVGDLIDETDPYWHLYLLLNDILILSLSKRLPKDAGAILEVLVAEHHRLYLQLTGSKLKPKHHFLVHYNSRLLFLFGPLGALSTIRFEGKHKFLKMVANVCCSRRNLPLTVAVKQQMSLCYRFICQQSIRPKFTVGSGQIFNLKDFDQYQAFSLTLPQEIFDNTDQFCAKWVDFCGTTYRQGMVLATGIDNVRCPTFAKIEKILVFNHEPLFICSPFYTLGLDSHIRGYEVTEITGQLNWFSLSHSDLLDPFPLSVYVTADGNKVIIPKHLLLVSE